MRGGRSGSLAGCSTGEVQSGGADFGDIDDASALDGRFHGLDQCEDELVESNQTQAKGAGAGEREPLAHLVEGQQRVGPAVSRAEHVPGAEDGGIKMPIVEHLLALGAHRDVVLHHWSGVGDAEIDEMAHAELCTSGDSLAGRNQVNSAKLGGFRWRWMRDADQMDESIGRANELAVGVGFERIARDDLTFSGQLGFRAGADQYANPMSTLEKNGNESGADIAGSSRDEDTAGVVGLWQGFDSQQEPYVGDGCSHSVGTLPGAASDGGGICAYRP